MAKCSVCDRDARALGYCKRHYNHAREHGDPLAGRFIESNPTWCTVPGCDGRARVKGHCAAHNERVRRTGSTQPEKPVKRRRPGGGRKAKSTESNDSVRKGDNNLASRLNRPIIPTSERRTPDMSLKTQHR